MCLRQTKIHISSINDNRQPLLHPYNKALTILPIKIVVVINRHYGPPSGKTLLGLATLMVAVVPVHKDSSNDKLSVRSGSS